MSAGMFIYFLTSRIAGLIAAAVSETQQSKYKMTFIGSLRIINSKVKILTILLCTITITFTYSILYTSVLTKKSIVKTEFKVNFR